MNAPTIDFAAPGTRRWRWSLALLALALAGCAWTAWRYVSLERELEAVQARIEAAGSAARRERNAGPPPPPKIEAARLAATNGAIARLNIPWSELLAAFEVDAGKDIALLGLLPDAKRRIVLVQAEARDARAMVDFAERLRVAAPLTTAFLIKHERREQDPGQPYRFTVEVHWEAPR